MEKRGPKPGGKKKRKYTKRAKPEGSIEDMKILPFAETVAEDIRALSATFVASLKFIRKELIKSRKEVYDLKDSDRFINSLTD